MVRNTPGITATAIARLEFHQLPQRRFPAPWSVEERPACFVVRDHSGQQLAYVYFEDEPGPALGSNINDVVISLSVVLQLRRVPFLPQRPRDRLAFYLLGPNAARRDSRRLLQQQ